MKTLIFIFGLLGWISCHDETRTPDKDVVETDGVWLNELAADGCSWHFTLTSGDSLASYVPDDASLPLIEKELGKIEGAYSRTTVHIKYSLTGGKSTVPCGWGKSTTYDQITVLEIHKK